MKKIGVVLIVLMLLCTAFAVAEETAVYEFDGFTIELENEIIGEVYERLDGQIWFIVYPQYDENNLFHPNLNCVWTEGYADLERFDTGELAQTAMLEIQNGMIASGIGCENVQVLAHEHLEIDAVDGVMYMIGGDYDYSSLGVDLKTKLYTKIYQLSDEYSGTFTFTLTAKDLETIETMDTYVASVRWD